MLLYLVGFLTDHLNTRWIKEHAKYPICNIYFQVLLKSYFLECEFSGCRLQPYTLKICRRQIRSAHYLEEDIYSQLLNLYFPSFQIHLSKDRPTWVPQGVELQSSGRQLAPGYLHRCCVASFSGYLCSNINVVIFLFCLISMAASVYLEQKVVGFFFFLKQVIRNPFFWGEVSCFLCCFGDHSATICCEVHLVFTTASFSYSWTILL